MSETAYLALGADTVEYTCQASDVMMYPRRLRENREQDVVEELRSGG